MQVNDISLMTWSDFLFFTISELIYQPAKKCCLLSQNLCFLSADMAQ